MDALRQWFSTLYELVYTNVLVILCTNVKITNAKLGHGCFKLNLEEIAHEFFLSSYFSDRKALESLGHPLRPFLIPSMIREQVELETVSKYIENMQRMIS